MKNVINWKLFAVLLAACVVASLLVIPYQMALSPALAELFGSKLALVALAQAALSFSIALFFGLLLAKRAGFGLPILDGVLKGERQTEKLRAILGLSIGLGMAAGALVIALSVPFGRMSLDFLKAEMSVATWKGFLASFYGGIAEEVISRLFLVSLLAWIFSTIRKTPDGRPTRAMAWSAIIVSAVLFGLGHLGITSQLTAVTPAVVLRAVLLNGVPGIIFGWLFWKKGLESAIIAHFSADIVIHVITPLAAAPFV